MHQIAHFYQMKRNHLFWTNWSRVSHNNNTVMVLYIKNLSFVMWHKKKPGCVQMWRQIHDASDCTYTHWILLFDFLAMSLIPLSTLVMSYTLLLRVPSFSVASLRSRIPSGAEWSRSMKRLVSRPSVTSERAPGAEEQNKQKKNMFS